MYVVDYVTGNYSTERRLASAVASGAWGRPSWCC